MVDTRSDRSFAYMNKNNGNTTYLSRCEGSSLSVVEGGRVQEPRR